MTACEWVYDICGWQWHGQCEYNWKWKTIIKQHQMELNEEEEKKTKKKDQQLMRAHKWEYDESTRCDERYNIFSTYIKYLYAILITNIEQKFEVIQLIRSYYHSVRRVILSFIWILNHFLDSVLEPYLFVCVSAWMNYLLLLLLLFFYLDRNSVCSYSVWKNLLLTISMFPIVLSIHCLTDLFYFFFRLFRFVCIVFLFQLRLSLEMWFSIELKYCVWCVCVCIYVYFHLHIPMFIKSWTGTTYTFCIVFSGIVEIMKRCNHDAITTIQIPRTIVGFICLPNTIFIFTFIFLIFISICTMKWNNK